MYISGHRQHSLTTSGQPTLYGVTHYIYMVFMETYMPNVEWHIVITQWMIGIVGYYRIGYIIGHVVDPEIYQFSSMRSFLQYAVQSPV